MTSRLFKKIAFPAFVIAVIGCGWFLAAQAAGGDAGNLSRAEVEKIVQEYIMNHPQDILDSVDAHQKKTVQARSDEALKLNSDQLFKEAGAPEVGNPQGDITIVEFFDYNCGYCKHALPAIQALLEKDKNLRIIFKDFPILGPTSETSAKWALAAQKQNKYFDYHRTLMENKTPIDDTLLEKTARDVGMDVEQAKKDIAGSDIMLQLEKNRSLADSLGITGTPAFIIGTDIIRGMLPLEEMEKRIAEQRAAPKK